MDTCKILSNSVQLNYLIKMEGGRWISHTATAHNLSQIIFLAYYSTSPTFADHAEIRNIHIFNDTEGLHNIDVSVCSKILRD